MTRAALAALVVVVLGALGSAARADDDKPDVQRMRFIENGKDLTVSTSVAKLFDSPAYEALKSGFPTTVVIQTWVYPKDSSSPVAYVRIVRAAVYDVWDEEWTIRLEGSPKGIVVKYPADTLKLLTTIDALPVAKLTDLPYGDTFELAIRVDLNPVSKETMAEVRRWLSQGTAGGVDRGGAFFGSFVSVFVNPKIADADRVLRLRSQPFFRPKP
jgi:hypothetical protein